jgi:MFS family permease
VVCCPVSLQVVNPLIYLVDLQRRPPFSALRTPYNMGRLITAGSAIFLAIGGFLFGYDSGIISSTIVQPNFVSYFGAPTASQSGGIVAAFQGGAILGALSVSWLADLLGRVRVPSSLPRILTNVPQRYTVLVGSCISVFGCALQAGAASIGMMIAGRLFAGIAVGLLAAVVPMYCVSPLQSKSHPMLDSR